MLRSRACVISASVSCAATGTPYRRPAPPHLPRHLLFRILAYRLQADHLGDLETEKAPARPLAAAGERTGRSG